MENGLAEALRNKEFVITYELIPGRGANEETQEKMMEEARELVTNKRIHALSITDNPSGNPALLADVFAQDVMNLGATPLVHFTCKDRSRNQIESQLDGLERLGIQNILCMTGDYPISGYNGCSKPVFDIDSVQLIQQVSAMNEGLSYPARGGVAHQKPTHFVPGAVVNPFKYTEGELIPQYDKLYKKCFAGVKFLISQIGFDVRKMEELLMVMNEQGYGDVPVLANIFVLPAGVAKSMNAGNFPGCIVTDELLAVIQEEAKAEDKGKEARVMRAAKLVAVAKGLGYSGVHIGGIGLTPEMANYIIEKSEELADNWMEYTREFHYGVKDGFYLYKQDPETGLNLKEHTQLAPARNDRAVQKTYRLARIFHKFMFTPGKKFFPFMQWFMYRKELKHGPNRHHPIEHTGKSFLFGCMDCGDCGLPSTAYVCPMTQCPKCQRNGPCGGSHGGEGWCEVYPGERLCIFYRAYHRLRKYGEEEKLVGYIAPPNNWELFGGSPWAAYFLGRDNIQRRIYLNSSLRHETPDPYVPKKDRK